MANVVTRKQDYVHASTRDEYQPKVGDTFRIRSTDYTVVEASGHGTHLTVDAVHHIDLTSD